MKIIVAIFISAFAFAFFYLLGSFYSASFKIQVWTEFTRFCISFIGGIFAILSGGIFYNKGKM